MVPQVTAVAECLTAVLAAEPPVARMSPLMFVQVGHGGKALATIITCVRLLPRVNSLVNIEVIGLFECSAAQFAAVRLFLRMDTSVDA